jgi:hypothetical protein
MAENRSALDARRADAPARAPTLKTAFATNDSEKPNSGNAAESQAAARRIVIRAEAFGQGFDVLIDPPAPWAHYDQERPNIRSARRYAASLRIVNPSWKIDDQSGEPA